MITVENREEIRRAYYNENKSIRQIAREQRRSRHTVAKALLSAEPEGYTLKEERAAPVLGPYKARLDELLKENESMPRKQRRTGHLIYTLIQGEGYAGSEIGVLARLQRGAPTARAEAAAGVHSARV